VLSSWFRWFGASQFGLVRFGLVRFGLVRFGLVRFGLVRFGLVRFGLGRLLLLSSSCPPPARFRPAGSCPRLVAGWVRPLAVLYTGVAPLPVVVFVAIPRLPWAPEGL
jgi:hypothetical protein